MRLFVMALGILFLITPVPVIGQTDAKWHEDGHEVPNTEWRSSDGPFMAMLFFTDDPEALYHDWNSNALPKVKGVEAIRPGKHFEAIIVFVDCKSNAKGQCRVSSDWRITTADGRSLGKADGVPTWIDKRPGRPGELMIAEHGVGMAAEPDFEGSYLFKVEVKDEVSGRAVKLKRQIAVTATAE